jgi:hypothetical protein
LILFVIFIYNKIKRNDANHIANSSLVIYGIIFLAISVYIANGRFSGVVEILSNSSNVLFNGFTSLSNGSSSSELNSYLISTSNLNKIKVGINALFVAIIILFFILIKTKNRDKQNIVILCSIISLIPMAILLFIWLEYWGVLRLAEWGGLFSIVCVGLLFSIKHYPKKLLSIICILAVSSACIAYLTDENHAILRITDSETTAVDWSIENENQSSAFFSDFRISGYIISKGHLKVTGVNEVDYNTSFVIENLNYIYYSNNTNDGNEGINNVRIGNNETIDTIILSNVMIDPIPGIKGYDYAYKHANSDFTHKFTVSTNFDCTYSNGQTFVFNKV